MKNRMSEIKQKGFNLIEDNDDITTPYESIDFSKIKVGVKQLDDATLEINQFKRINPSLGSKKSVLSAIDSQDIKKLREISNFFMRVSGIYSRLCKHMAYLYNYDWLVTPYINDHNSNTDKLLKSFYNVLNYMDNFEVKKILQEIALKVIINGAYYGYIIKENNEIAIQELPPEYCRSRFKVGSNHAIEFNMKYFDDNFRDTTQKMKILNLFPKEFKKGYELYKKNKLVPDYMGDTAGWYLLDVESAVKFNLNGSDIPLFIGTIPAIIDLSEAQELDIKKMQQQILKIIIQKMPIDKNGDLVFDLDEVRDLHNNAVGMLKGSIGTKVLTSFADIDVADLADTRAASTSDELEKVERGIFNASGSAQNLFNTNGNLALEKSILNDEALMMNLLLQFETFLNRLLKPFNKTKKVTYKIHLLPTTIFNYKDMAKIYKEQTQMGYSKMLPQIALGQSQSSILANAYFENDILDLVHVFIPPLSSNTMSSDVLLEKEGSGRPELEDDKKSEKTIKNKESMN